MASGPELTFDVEADRTLLIRLSGAWHLRAGVPSTKAIETAIAGAPPPAAVAFDVARLATWDSSALLVLNPRKADALSGGHSVIVEQSRATVRTPRWRRSAARSRGSRSRSQLQSLSGSERHG